ncbi:MAG: sigma-70 family RNA polymerase sigma factor [Clostridia bacterium]|nr:sigma-70 family RNA polymerase sigma factor [Clostridia bacterium]
MSHGADGYRRYLAGDDKAVAEIIEAYRAGLELFLQQMTGDENTAEELTQETFVFLFTRKPHYKPTATFKTWLYTIAKNRALRYLKKQKRTVALSFEEALCIPDLSPSVEEQYFATEDAQRVHAVLGKLKPEYREILWLTYFEGLSNKESAAILGKSVHNIEVLVSRARKALKNQLVKDGFADENQ